MESNRQQKINRLIQKELGEMFLLETKKMSGVLISVTHVRVSPDLGLAHVHLSFFPPERGEELLQNINENVKSIRFGFGARQPAMELKAVMVAGVCCFCRTFLRVVSATIWAV